MFSYIENTAALEQLVVRLGQCDVVTVDTEFQRTDTYYPEVGLIQIYDGESCYLIDPLVASINVLGDLLADESTLKVLHACSEDLEVFESSIGVRPASLFDTQIAAAMLGVGFSISYQNLVEHYLNIVVPKEETRSDWLRRPLTSAQLEYAALDVIHLFDVYQRQAVSLKELGRSAWVAEECAALGGEIATTISPRDAYRRIKGAARMRPEDLNLLRELCAWREETARIENMPRNRIVDERMLLNLVRTPPGSRHDLQEAGLKPRQIRKYGDQLLDTVALASAVPAESWPPLLAGSHVIDNKQVKSLRAIVEERAEAMNIAPEMLAKRKQLEELLRNIAQADDPESSLPVSLSGWRKSAIGEPLLEALRSS